MSESLNLKLANTLLRIVGEFGQASGGEILTYNQFTGPKADEPRKYFSIGVSLGW